MAEPERKTARPAKVDDLKFLLRSFSKRVDVLVGAGNLVDHPVVIATLDAAGLRFQVHLVELVAP